MLINSPCIWWLDPPDFSDGIQDSHPVFVFDEDFIRSKYLTHEFRDYLWRSHYNYDLSVHSNDNNPYEDKDERLRYCILDDNFTERFQWNDLSKPLRVDFYVPIDYSMVKYHTFALLVGQELKNIMLDDGNIKLITKVHVSNMHFSSPVSTILGTRESDDLEIDVETISDDETFQVDILLNKKRYPNAKVEKIKSKIRMNSYVDFCYEEQEISALTSLSSKNDQLIVNAGSYFKIEGLPRNYRVYEKIIVEYPPPPPFYNSITKPSTDSRLRFPKIKLIKSFVVFGHPSGQELDRLSFSQHLAWLYRMSGSPDGAGLSIVDRSIHSGSGCQCDLCPYNSSLLTGFRRGEVVWVSTDALVRQGIIIDLFSFTFTDVGLAYWPGEIHSKSLENGVIKYRIQLISFPRFTERRKTSIISVLNDIDQTILPFSRFRQTNVPYLRKISLQTGISSIVARSFILAYQKLLKSSHQYYPVLEHDSHSVSALIFGCEMLFPGDWVNIDPECHLVVNIAPSTVRNSRVRKKCWLLKIDSMEWKKSAFVVPGVNSRLDSNLWMHGNIYFKGVDNSISLEVADACIQISDVLGRSYVWLPEVCYPMGVDFINPELALSPFIQKYVCDESDPITCRFDDGELVNIFHNGGIVSHSRSFTYFIRRHRFYQARLARKGHMKLLEEYASSVIGRIPAIITRDDNEDDKMLNK